MTVPLYLVSAVTRSAAAGNASSAAVSRHFIIGGTGRTGVQRRALPESDDHENRSRCLYVQRPIPERKRSGEFTFNSTSLAKYRRRRSPDSNG